MKTTTTAAAYLKPECVVIEFEGRVLLSASTDEYSVDPDELNEDDWE